MVAALWYATSSISIWGHCLIGGGWWQVTGHLDLGGIVSAELNLLKNSLWIYKLLEPCTVASMSCGPWPSQKMLTVLWEPYYYRGTGVCGACYPFLFFVVKPLSHGLKSACSESVRWSPLSKQMAGPCPLRLCNTDTACSLAWAVKCKRTVCPLTPDCHPIRFTRWMGNSFPSTCF